MAGKERPAVVRAKQELEAIRLKEQGWTQQQIADHLSISQATVSRALKAAKNRYIQRSDAMTAKLIRREVATADYVEEEAQAAWEAVPEYAERNTNHLKRMLEASDRRAKLLGLVVDRTDVTSGGEKIGLSADKLAKLNAEADDELTAWENERFGAGEDSDE